MSEKKSRRTSATGQQARHPPVQESGAPVPAALIRPARGTPLAELPTGVTPDLLAAFQALGYRTVEEALGVLQVAGRAFARFFGLPETALEAFAGVAQAVAAPVTAQERAVIDYAVYSLGAALGHVSSLTRAPDLPTTIAPPLPTGETATVSLIPQMPAIRHQRRRGTCVAFAALAAYEHFLNTNGTPVDLSEQFLYWSCKTYDGYNGEGTWLRVAFDRLCQDGCCLEEKWPYVPDAATGNEGQGPPPPGAQVQALSYRPSDRLLLAPTAVADLKAVLQSGSCIAVSIPVYNTLMLNPQAMKTGDIPNPVPGELSVGGHAVCLVGYADNPSTPGLGGGRFLLRNSWGEAFGFASAYGPGYGTISYAYMGRSCREAFAVVGCPVLGRPREGTHHVPYP
jgi:hypothetical protein